MAAISVLRDTSVADRVSSEVPREFVVAFLSRADKSGYLATR
ncbi:hypothetical protein ACIQAD_10955 [Streptomyces sp. NPDC088551]